MYNMPILGANLLVDSTGLNLRIGDLGAAAQMWSKDGTVDGEFQGSHFSTSQHTILSRIFTYFILH